MYKITCWLLGLIVVGCGTIGRTGDQWYRGNTHTHTFWSDGNHFPEMAAHWYKSHGYQFVVLTDHNLRPSESEWVDLKKKKGPTEKAVEDLSHTFGADAVLTQQDDERKTLHRMLSYEEVAARVNEPEVFVAVPGEELTARVHMSAINTKKTIGVDWNVSSHLEAAQSGAARVRAHEAESNHPVFLQLNHPNWQYEMTAEILAATLDADGFELINPACHNQGDEHSPSTERLWDIATTLRLKKYEAAPLWAVAADDTHNYHDFEDNSHKTNPGRAFVMVRAEELSGNAVAQSLKTGSFYSSTGVQLSDVSFDPETRTLSVEVDPSDPGASYEIQFIGTPKSVSIGSEPSPPLEYTKKVPLRENGTLVMENGKRVMVEKQMVRDITRVYSDRIGKTLQTVSGKTKVSFKLPDDLLYVRCKITDTSHAGYEWGGETIPRAAWTQPVGWSL